MKADTVEAALERARGAVDEVGDLPWQNRSEIRRRLLERPPAWEIVELESARHVLPVWTSAYSATRPLELLELVEATIANPANRERLAADTRALDSVIDELAFEAEGDHLLLTAGIAGYAAVCAAASVLGWNDDGPPNELDGDPYSWSASFAAAIAAAGGATWEPEFGSPDRRSEYWVWWLTEAVPQALARQPFVVRPGTRVTLANLE